MKTLSLEKDGSLVIVDDFGTRVSINPDQIAAHRRDPELEAELTPELKDQIAANDERRLAAQLAAAGAAAK